MSKKFPSEDYFNLLRYIKCPETGATMYKIFDSGGAVIYKVLSPNGMYYELHERYYVKYEELPTDSPVYIFMNDHNIKTAYVAQTSKIPVEHYITGNNKQDVQAIADYVVAHYPKVCYHDLLNSLHIKLPHLDNIIKTDTRPLFGY